MSLSDPLTSILTSLQRSSIIPDVIPPDANFFPTVLFSVLYPTGKEASLGTELTREDTLDEPEISFTPMVANDESAGDSTKGGSSGEASYTLVMTDPDAPSREDHKYREFRHWVITGLKSPIETSSTTDPSNLLALKTKPSTTPYRPPGPPPGSGVHRYTFLLFQEPSPSPPPSESSESFSIPQGAKEYGAELEDRRSWSAYGFGQQYGLKLVGASYFVVRSKD